MINFLKLWFILVAGFTPKVFITCEPDWTFDLISVDVDNKTPDKIYIELYVTRLRRGVFALNGFMDFKEDVTDDNYISVTVYYSWLGSEFAKTPLHIPETTFSKFMNTFYKDLIMDSLLNCTENALQVESIFVPPLSKRVISLNNCNFSNENMPSKLRSGYYKTVIQYTKNAEGSVELITKVEPK